MSRVEKIIPIVETLEDAARLADALKANTRELVNYRTTTDGLKLTRAQTVAGVIVGLVAVADFSVQLLSKLTG